MSQHVPAFVREVAASLLDGSDLEASNAAALIQEALLAEGRALLQSQVDKVLSTALHCALVGAMAAFSALPAGQAGLQELAPRVHVEVRGTAGQDVLGGVFTVGSAPECSVQVFGDPTVLPLQCVVFSLAAGIVVVDAWSQGCTQPIARGRRGQGCIPVLAAACDAALLVLPDEKVVLQLGRKTTIALEQRRRPAPPQDTRWDEHGSKRARRLWGAARLQTCSTRVGSRESSTSDAACSSPAWAASRSRTPRSRR